MNERTYFGDPTFGYPPNRESIFKSSLPLVIFSALGAISIAVWWGPLASLFALAWRDEQYTHILLILPMSAALIFMEWKPPAGRSRVSATAGSAALLVAVLARAGTALPADVRLSLNILALVAWWMGAFIFCFGSSSLPASALSSLFPALDGSRSLSSF